MVDPTQDPDHGRRPSSGPRRDPAPPLQARRGRPASAVITDAQSATSLEMSGRIRRYTITMAFRMLCFVSMIFVQGWLRWALLGLAVFLPYIAVVLANQADQRSRPGQVEHGAPEDAPQLTVGEHVEVIDGYVVDDAEDGREGRVA